MNTPSTAFNRRQGLTLLGGVLAAVAAPAGAQPRQPQGPNCCTAADPLTPEESKWILWMREEEKFARDVYSRLYARWNARIFRNIAQSEERHFAAVGELITRYGLKDPALGLAEGAFANTELAALYARLIAKGETSLQDALEVGVLIEKQDITDLETAIQAAGKRDVKTVFSNLLAGSLNHLEAFENGLDLVCANA
jgi:hypothetical protein